MKSIFFFLASSILAVRKSIENVNVYQPSSNLYWNTACQDNSGNEVSALDYLIHTQNAPKESYSFHFLNDKEVYIQVLGVADGQSVFLAQEWSTKHIKLSIIPYPFTYIEKDDFTYQLGWDKFALDWSNENYGKCNSKANYIRIGERPISSSADFKLVKSNGDNPSINIIE